MPRRHVGMIVVVLISLFVQMTPAPVFAQIDQPGPGIFPPPPPEPPSPVAPPPLQVAPVADSFLPSLVLHLRTTPELVGPGDLVTTTLTVINQSPHPAEGLVVTLPLPMSTVGVDTTASKTGWIWDLGTLNGESRRVLTATLRLTALPDGRALVLRAEATAKGLTEPVGVVGGTLATDDRGALAEPTPTNVQVLRETTQASDLAPLTPTPAALPSATAVSTTIVPLPAALTPPEARFTPGQPTTLTSRDGQVQVQFPAAAADTPLTLTFTTRAEQAQRAKVSGERVPPAVAGFHRGFGAFFLDATDAQGRAVHQFKAPLTVTVRFTPQQLEALGIAPGDLSIFWFDETKIVTPTAKMAFQGDWVPLPTMVDAERGSATFQVDHFSAFQLSDGSSPSSAFLPSLQGWQTDGFTGASSFSYPIEVPAGPGGLKPSLNLTYNSAVTDGSSGWRRDLQSSWVGKGWSLDTGAIVVNKIQYSSSSTVDHYALSFNGRSYDLMRAEARVGSPNPNDPTHWVWRPTDESFIRVWVENAGPSYAGRGGYEWGNPYQRHKWLVWDTDGTRYEFAEDVWWGWNRCTSSGSGDFAYMEASRWLLSKVVDTHGNAIDYAYGRASITYPQTCFHVQGTVDVDIWPSTITWAGGRYRVVFYDSIRTNDVQYEIPEYQYGDAPHETRRLEAVTVNSNTTGSWEMVRQYNFTYDTQLRSDARICTDPTCSTWGPESAYPKLTLTGIQRISKDALSALPATTFSYLTNGGTAMRPVGGWNRLTGMNNGQGGTLSLSYANIALAVNNSLFDNRHRVTSKVVTDGRGNSYTWGYSYGTPAVNFLGANLGDGLSTNPHPNSAVLYYNTYANYPYNSESWLVQRRWKEFRGHATMTETAPDGSQTKHYYYQGDVGCTPNVSAAQGSHAAVIADSCFVQLRNRELLKGREYKTEQLGVGGTPLLTSTDHSFGVAFYDYSWAPLSGLWRAFSYETETNEKLWEGSTSSSKRTEYFYNIASGTTCNNTSIDTYGNLRCIKEYDDSGALIRETRRYFATKNDAASYITNRPCSDAIYNSSGTLLALTHQLYDATSASGTIFVSPGALCTIGASGKGELQLERRYTDLPNNGSNTTIVGQDTVFTYDSYGNQTSVSTYSGAGTTYNTTLNAPIGGSAARTTSMVYDNPTTVVDETVLGLPYRITNPLNHTETAGYDYRMGTLTSITDANGQTTSAQYDAFGRMERIIRPGDTVAQPTTYVVYYDTEQPFRYAIVQREQGGTWNERVTQLFYDGLGRQIQSKAESNGQTQTIVSDTRYDGLGRATQQSQPRYVSETGSTFYSYTAPSGSASVMRWTTTTYDALGRASTITAPDNSVTTHRYGVIADGSNVFRYHDVTDAERHRTQQRYDSLGRLRKVDEISGNCGNYWGYSCASPYTNGWAVAATTRYSYSPLDLLTSVVDAKGNTTTLGYDTLGRKTSMSDPDMGSWSYAYDANGNLTRQTDAKGQRLCFYYDKLDRLTGKHQRTDNSCPATATNLYARYDYDQNSNGKGHRTYAETLSGSTITSANVWDYDARGRVSQAHHYVAALGGAWRSFASTYDSADRVTTQSYPAYGSQGAETVAYSYDSAWRQGQVCINCPHSNYSCHWAIGCLPPVGSPSNGHSAMRWYKSGTITCWGSSISCGWGRPAIAAVCSIGATTTILSVISRRCITPMARPKPIATTIAIG